MSRFSMILSLVALVFAGFGGTSFAQQTGGLPIMQAEGTGGDFISETSRNGANFDMEDTPIVPGDLFTVRITSPMGTLVPQPFIIGADILPVSQNVNIMGILGLSSNQFSLVDTISTPGPLAFGLPLNGSFELSFVIPQSSIWVDGGTFVPGGAPDIGLWFQSAILNPASPLTVELSNVTKHQVFSQGFNAFDTCQQALQSEGFSDADLGMANFFDTTQLTNTLETTGLQGFGTQTQFGVVGAGQGSGDSNGPAPEAIFKFTSVTGGAYTFSLCNSDFDTRLWIMEPQCDPLVGIAHNEDSMTCTGAAGSSLRSQLDDICLQPGQIILVVIDGFNANAGQAEVVITRDTEVLVQDVVPNAGSSNGTDLIELRGCNLANVNQVLFDGIPAATLNVIDDETVEVTTPPHASGTIDVQVSDGGAPQVLLGGFTYVNAAETTTSFQLGDDSSAMHNLIVPVDFAGELRTSLFLGSNGQVTFGGGTTDFFENVGSIFQGWSGSPTTPGLPGVAVMFGDFNRGGPGNGASIEVIEDSVLSTVSVVFRNQIHTASISPAGTVSCTFGINMTSSALRLDYQGFVPGTMPVDGFAFGVTDGDPTVGNDVDFTSSGGFFGNNGYNTTLGQMPESLAELVPGGVPFNGVIDLIDNGLFSWTVIATPTPPTP